MLALYGAGGVLGDNRQEGLDFKLRQYPGSRLATYPRSRTASAVRPLRHWTISARRCGRRPRGFPEVIGPGNTPYWNSSRNLLIFG